MTEHYLFAVACQKIKHFFKKCIKLMLGNQEESCSAHHNNIKIETLEELNVFLHSKDSCVTPSRIILWYCK